MKEFEPEIIPVDDDYSDDEAEKEDLVTVLLRRKTFTNNEQPVNPRSLQSRGKSLLSLFSKSDV